MTHEPGRERHMIHKCENCGARCEDRELNEDVDEYWCSACIDSEFDHQLIMQEIDPLCQGK